MLSTAQAAHYIGVTKGCLDRWRLQGKGPPWIRIGTRIIRYRIEDLDEWLRNNRIDPSGRPPTDDEDPPQPPQPPRPPQRR